MARNTGGLFNGQDVLGGQRLVELEPVENCRLRPIDYAAESRLAPRTAHRLCERGFKVLFDAHAQMHTETPVEGNRKIFVALYRCAGKKAL